MPNKCLFWVIGNQLLRSGTSIGANVVEAKSASSRKDYTNYFTIALKSANETKYWLLLLKCSVDYEKDVIETLLKEVSELANIIGASVVKLKKGK